MASSVVVLAVAGVYLAVCLVLGMMAGRGVSDSATGYVAGDRGLGLLVLYFVMGASIFSAFAFLGAPGMTYSRGLAVCYILAYGVFGFVPFYWLGPRAARVGRRYGFVTQAEMVAHRFGSRSLAGVMAVASMAAFLPYLALQMKGAGIVLEAVTRGAVSEAVGAAVVYAVVLAYVLRSGVLGVGWTNTFQGLVMMVLAWGLGLFLPYHLYGGVGAMFDAIEARRPELLKLPGLDAGGAPWPWPEYASAVAVSAIGFSFWPHLFMKAFSARDERTIRRTVVLYPTFQVFLVPVFLIGFAGVLFTPAPGAQDEVLPHLLMHLEIPSVVVGLFCAGALAASMSSGDAMAHAAASIAVRDGWCAALGKSLEPAGEQRAIRQVLLLVFAAAYAVAVSYRGSLVMLLLTTYGVMVQFAPAVVATLYLRRATGAGVLAGLVVGSVIAVMLTVCPGWRPWPVHAGAYGLVLNVLALVVVSRCTAGRRAGDPELVDVAAARGGVA